MKEFWGGCASGIVQSIIGHPFDTIKVLMQTNKPLYKNPFHYYKGVTFPTAFNIMCTGLSFDIQSRLHKLTDSHYIAGAGTGTMIAPIDHRPDVPTRNNECGESTSALLREFFSLVVLYKTHQIFRLSNIPRSEPTGLPGPRENELLYYQID